MTKICKPRRDIQIHLRITSDESEYLENRAATMGIPLSGYVRYILFGRLEQGRKLLSDTTDERIYQIRKRSDAPLLTAEDDDNLYELHGIFRNRKYGVFRAREDGELDLIMQIEGTRDEAKQYFLRLFSTAKIIEETVKRMVLSTANHHARGDLYVADVFRRD